MMPWFAKDFSPEYVEGWWARARRDFLRLRVAQRAGFNREESDFNRSVVADYIDAANARDALRAAGRLP